MKVFALACLAAVIAACSSGSSGGDGGTQCPAGLTMCGSFCASLQGDPDNCGKCGVVCPHGQICDLGACTSGISDAAHDTATAYDAPPDSTSDSASDAGSPSDAAPESSSASD